jgi:surface antigen
MFNQLKCPLQQLIRFKTNMKKQISKLLMAALLLAQLSALSACQQPGAAPGSGINKETGGTVLGGVGGALLGSQIGHGKGSVVAGVAGGLLGAYLGNQIGAQMDRNDMAYYNQTSQRALEVAPVGQAQTWRNPDSGNYGTITPTKTYQSNGEYCREYQQTITVSGKTQKGYGTACRQPDGSWEVRS